MNIDWQKFDEQLYVVKYIGMWIVLIGGIALWFFS